MAESVIVNEVAGDGNGRRSLIGVWMLLIGNPLRAFAAIKAGRLGGPARAFLLFLVGLILPVGAFLLLPTVAPRLSAGHGAGAYLAALGVTVALLLAGFFAMVFITHLLMKLFAGATHFRALFTAYAYIGTLNLITALLTVALTRAAGPVAFYRAAALTGIWYAVLCALAVTTFSGASLRRAAAVAVAGWAALVLLVKFAWPWYLALLHSI